MIHLSQIQVHALYFNVIVSSMILFHAYAEQPYQNPSQSLAHKYQNANGPEQIHLSLGSSAKDIVIVWSTPLNETSFIEYGKNVETLSKVEGKLTELTQNNHQAVNYLHRAELRNLNPGEQYAYRIVNSLSGMKSSIFSFDVPHTDHDKSDIFLVVADMGLITKSLQFLVHEALNFKYEAVFHIGDIAYNLDLEGGSRGDEFMRRVQKFAAKLPYLTTPGDHEREAMGQKDTFYHYRHRFSMPNAPWPMTEESLWYSINIGRTHFVSINTEALDPKSTLGLKQLDWLREDLLKANDQREFYPWIIVMGHKPMYCTKSVMKQDCDKEVSPLRLAIEDILFEYGVDLYLSGHKHIYERSWPMHKGRIFQTNYINPMGPVYMIIGSMGYEYLLDMQKSEPYWLAFASSDRKKELFARLMIHNSTTLVWSVHSAHSNEEVDKMIIIQKSHGSFGTPGPHAVDEKLAHKIDKDSLPPEPFNFEESAAEPESYLGSRKMYLYTFVFFVSFLLFIFIRQAKVRRVLRL